MYWNDDTELDKLVAFGFNQVFINHFLWCKESIDQLRFDSFIYTNFHGLANSKTVEELVDHGLTPEAAFHYFSFACDNNIPLSYVLYNMNLVASYTSSLTQQQMSIISNNRTFMSSKLLAREKYSSVPCKTVDPKLEIEFDEFSSENVFFHGTVSWFALSILEIGVQLSGGRHDFSNQNYPGFYLTKDLLHAKSHAVQKTNSNFRLKGARDDMFPAIVVFRRNNDRYDSSKVLDLHELDLWRKVVVGFRTFADDDIPYNDYIIEGFNSNNWDTVNNGGQPTCDSFKSQTCVKCMATRTHVFTPIAVLFLIE